MDIYGTAPGSYASTHDGVFGTFAKGLCSPVLVAIVLVVVAMFTAIRRGHSSTFMYASAPDSKRNLLLSSVLLIAFLWGLCYFQFSGAAWFFLIFPALLAGAEISSGKAIGY